MRKEFEYKTESLHISIPVDLQGDITNLRAFIDKFLNQKGKEGFELISYPESAISLFFSFWERKNNPKLIDFVKENQTNIELLTPEINKIQNFEGGYIKFCFKREKELKSKYDFFAIRFTIDELKSLNENMHYASIMKLILDKISKIKNQQIEIVTSPSFEELKMYLGYLSIYIDDNPKKFEKIQENENKAIFLVKLEYYSN